MSDRPPIEQKPEDPDETRKWEEEKKQSADYGVRQSGEDKGETAKWEKEKDPTPPQESGDE